MSAVRVLAYLFGLVLLLVGVLGFMPAFTPNNLLFGYFAVNDLHNVFHIVTGVAALVLAMDTIYSKWFFRIFGLIYAAAAAVGFWHPDMMGMMTMNMADNILHTVIGIVSLFIGFFV